MKFSDKALKVVTRSTATEAATMLCSASGVPLAHKVAGVIGAASACHTVEKLFTPKDTKDKDGE